MNISSPPPPPPPSSPPPPSPPSTASLPHSVSGSFKIIGPSLSSLNLSAVITAIATKTGVPLSTIAASATVSSRRLRTLHQASASGMTLISWTITVPTLTSAASIVFGMSSFTPVDLSNASVGGVTGLIVVETPHVIMPLGDATMPRPSAAPVLTTSVLKTVRAEIYGIGVGVGFLLLVVLALVLGRITLLRRQRLRGPTPSEPLPPPAQHADEKPCLTDDRVAGESLISHCSCILLQYSFVDIGG